MTMIMILIIKQLNKHISYNIAFFLAQNVFVYV